MRTWLATLPLLVWCSAGGDSVAVPVVVFGQRETCRHLAAWRLMMDDAARANKECVRRFNVASRIVFAEHGRIVPTKRNSWKSHKPLAYDLGDPRHDADYERRRIGSLVTPDKDVLVIELAVGGRGACIRACLWRPGTNILGVFRDVRAWAARHSLLVHAELEGADATRWMLSGMDP
jgi:hypothetical protein